MGGTSVVASHKLMNGLKAYWKCDEAAGSTLYDSHNNYDLTIGGTGSSVGVEAGKIGTYGYKNVGTSYAYWATETDFSPNWQQFTWAGWVNLNEVPTVSGYAAIVMSLGASTLSQSIYISNISDRACGRTYTSNGLNYLVVDNTVLVTGQWYFLTFVCPGDGTALKMFCDSIQNEFSSQTPTSLYPLASPIVNFELGNSPASHVVGLKAVFSEFAIWHRPLLDDEITELYNGGTGLTYPFI